MPPLNISVSPTSWVPSHVQLKGTPFSFKDREYLIPIYDSPYPKRFIKAGRQVEKSTSLCNIMIQEMACQPYMNALYVSSSSVQTGVFSTSYFKDTLRGSPALETYYRPGSSKYTDKVYEKQFTNNSRAFFRYAFLSADRTRGISARMLLLDEIQDMLPKNIPIMEECTSHFMKDRQWIYSGTPKTFENAIEIYWRRTTQKEWAVKCTACGHWNILGEDNVREKGLSCDRKTCEKLIDPRNGQWARFGSIDAEFDGYRISQLMVPWTVWKEIWIKYKNYPRQQFFNEVLGLSCELASSIITQIDLMKACAAGGYQMFMSWPRERYYQSLHAGVDWGAGQGSMTVLVIGGFRDGVFEIIYMRKFDPARVDQDEIVKEIAKTCAKFKCVRAGADWGFGFMQNQELQKAMPGCPVWRYYSSATQKANIAFNKKGRFFVINRNSVIGDLFNSIKRGQVRFFSWRQFEPFSRDFLGVFPDYRTDTRMLYYNHPADVPDDAVHATNYARTTAMLYHGFTSAGRSSLDSV